jgi:hypothetical protein
VVELGPDRTCPIGSVGSVTVVVSSDEKFAGDLEPALKSTFDDNFFQPLQNPIDLSLFCNLRTCSLPSPTPLKYYDPNTHDYRKVGFGPLSPVASSPASSTYACSGSPPHDHHESLRVRLHLRLLVGGGLNSQLAQVLPLER